MKRWLAIILLLAAPIAAVAQIGRYQTQVLGATGLPLSGASARICVEPAVGTPCTALASIFSDQALTHPISNPITTGADGVVAFFASNLVLYHLQVSGTGIVTYDISYQAVPFAIGTVTLTSPTITGTLSGTPTASGLWTFGAGITGSGNLGTLAPGTGILSSTAPFTTLQTFSAGITGTGNTGALTLGSGALAPPYSWGSLATFSAGITGTGNIGSLTLGTGALGASNAFTAPQSITTTGTYTNLAINWQSTILDGLTKANINSLQAGIYLTDVLDIGQLTPVGSTVQQASGLGVFTQVNSATTNQVSIYSQCAAGVNNAKCWGLNPSVADYDVNGVQYTSVTLHGAEIDINAKNSSTAGDAIFIQGNLAGNTLGNIGAIHIPKPFAGSWGYGLQIDDQALFSSNSQGLFIGSAGTVSVPSYQIILRGRDGTGVSKPARIFADSNGAQTNSGVMTTNGAYSTGSGVGDLVIYNGAGIKSDTAAHNAAYLMLQGNAANQVEIDHGNQGTLMSGKVTFAANGIAADGAGHKHKRFGATTATAASAFATQTTTYSWTTTFADTNYTVSCTPEGAATGTPILQSVITKNAGSIIVQVMAGTAVASSFAGLDCIADHD